MKGKVYLVGAGPGDIGLLTIRAASLLRSADVIVHDGLINNALLELFPHPEKIDFGKKRNNPKSQKDINRLLVDLAVKGKMVVRLKGGDPTIFARGSEEALYLKEQGIPFEIIPGVTAGYSVPAYAGIPVTDRNLASVVIFVTGQERDDKKSSVVDWKALAPIEGSLVIYMGVKRLPLIVQSLMDAGKSPATLVSVIEAGTLARQRVIEGTLADIAAKVEDQNVESPAIIVIGQVNQLREELNWFDPETMTHRSDEFARELIAHPKPTSLKHGGDIYGFAKETNMSQESILDFSSNINPLGIAPAIEKAYKESLACIAQYPDQYTRELCAEAAGYLSIKPDHVIAGNGAIALIDLAVRTIRPKRALLAEPCFNEYRRLLYLQSTDVRQIFLKEEDDFNFSYQDILQGLDGVDMVILGYPNNPTGTALKRQEMIALIEETQRRKIFLIVDEAFVDWDPERSIYQEIRRSSSLIVIRSLTKFYGLAGIRAGFALAAPEVIGRLRAVQEPWSCNAVAQRLSIAGLRDTEFQNKSRVWFKEESNHFYQFLSQIPEIKVFPSLANFFLIKLQDKEHEKTFLNFIKSKGIYLREMDGIAGLTKGYFRIALKDRQENLILITTLKEALLKDKCLSF